MAPALAATFGGVLQMRTYNWNVRRAIWAAIYLLLFTSLPVRSASATSTPAADFTSSLLYFNNVESNALGWQFQVNSTITFTALGYYDYTAASPQPSLLCCTPDSRTSGGLLDNHIVGIFNDSSQQLLTSTTVPAGTVGTLIGSFTYVSIPSYVLGPGTYSVVGTQQGTAGVNPTDPVVFLFTALSTIPEITDLGGQYGFGTPGVLTFPQINSGYQAYMGPNFLVSTVSGVPGPTAGAGLPGVLFAGGGLLAWRRNRRMRRVSAASAAALRMA